ncbi:hypothetical protein PR048_015114 [Dryococelus australis]|uniref:Uncharacterized protein n=1 Tax=Dryococelus australis TaxID=614101 RepID=A0ABQ9HG24_9NEOP|nr:hypothetical protein PR048_015114 [Dryococelus australis]
MQKKKPIPSAPQYTGNQCTLASIFISLPTTHTQHKMRHYSYIENTEPPAATLVVSYFKGRSVKIRRLPKKHNIRTASKPTTTIKTMLTKVKPSSDQQHTQECIYQVPCQCGSVYIGETGQPLSAHSVGKFCIHSQRAKCNKEIKESAFINCSSNVISQEIIELKVIWLPIIKYKVHLYFHSTVPTPHRLPLGPITNQQALFQAPPIRVKASLLPNSFRIITDEHFFLWTSVPISENRTKTCQMWGRPVQFDLTTSRTRVRHAILAITEVPGIPRAGSSKLSHGFLRRTQEGKGKVERRVGAGGLRSHPHSLVRYLSKSIMRYSNYLNKPFTPTYPHPLVLKNFKLPSTGFEPSTEDDSSALLLQPYTTPYTYPLTLKNVISFNRTRTKYRILNHTLLLASHPSLYPKPPFPNSSVVVRQPRVNMCTYHLHKCAITPNCLRRKSNQLPPHFGHQSSYSAGTSSNGSLPDRVIRVPVLSQMSLVPVLPCINQQPTTTNLSGEGGVEEKRGVTLPSTNSRSQHTFHGLVEERWVGRKPSADHSTSHRGMGLRGGDIVVHLQKEQVGGRGNTH